MTARTLERHPLVTRMIWNFIGGLENERNIFR
jgi:hypothetical protein